MWDFWEVSKKGREVSPPILSFNRLFGMILRWLVLQQPSCAMKMRVHLGMMEECLISNSSCLDSLAPNFFSVWKRNFCLVQTPSLLAQLLYQSTIHYFQSWHLHAPLIFYSLKYLGDAPSPHHPHTFLFLKLNGGSSILRVSGVGHEPSLSEVDSSAQMATGTRAPSIIFCPGWKDSDTFQKTASRAFQH